VIYTTGDNPQEDILLRGGSDRHLVVAAIRDNGPAFKAGVKAGDRLVSIDGKKDFVGLSADAVRERLQAPTMLVFLGFVGKLQAEVRLTCADRVCGLPGRHELVRGYNDYAPVQVCDERVFKAGIASLFFAIESGSEKPASVVHASNIPMFELQRLEAHNIVRGALEPEKPGQAFPKSEVAVGSEEPAPSAPSRERTDRYGGTLSKPGGDRGQVQDETQPPPAVDFASPLPEQFLNLHLPDGMPTIQKQVMAERLEGILQHEVDTHDLDPDWLGPQDSPRHMDFSDPEHGLSHLPDDIDIDPEGYLGEQTF
jgi:hypothetical protein